MRIGLVSPYAWTVPGGVNNHVMSLVRHLERAGNDVYVIAPAGDLRRSQTAIPTNFISAGKAVPGARQRFGGVRQRELLHARQDEPHPRAARARRRPRARAHHPRRRRGRHHDGQGPGRRHVPRRGGGFRLLRALASARRAHHGEHHPEHRGVRDRPADGHPAFPRRVPGDPQRHRDRALPGGQGRAEGRPAASSSSGGPEPRKGLPALLEAFQGLRRRLAGGDPGACRARPRRNCRITLRAAGARRSASSRGSPLWAGSRTT